MNEMSSNKQKLKIDFISDLLNNKKIGVSEKERLFALIAKEMDYCDENNQFVLKEIEIIKKKIGLIGEPQLSKKPSLPEYIDPKNNTAFLLQYNQNIILKSTTHNIDSNLLKSINDHIGIERYNFDRHIKEIVNEFNKLNNEFYDKTSKGLSEKIHAYLTGKGKPGEEMGWSENRIKMSWGAQDLKDWASKNCEKCPNPGADLYSQIFTFKRQKLNNGNYIANMNELVLFFKKGLTIRNDNNLRDLCKEWSFKFIDKVDICYIKVSKNVEFFTDVEKLGQAYRQLIELCIEVKPDEKPQVEIGLEQIQENDDKKIIFSILHKNSYFKKSIDDTLNRYGNTFHGLIKNQLNGLCEFKLRADFGDEGSAHLSIWPKNEKKEFTRIDKFEGVQYELILYK